MVFVDGGDGTATQYVTGADSEPRRILGGLMVPTALSRTGALSVRLTKSGNLFGQTITNTSGAPITLTSVTVERVTLSAGTATLTIRQGNGGTILASAPATAQDGGLTGPLTYTLAPGATVMIVLQATGGTLTAQLSSGHTWEGLTVGATLITGFTGGTGGAVAEDNGAPAAQLAFQFGAGGTAVRRVEVAAPLGGRVVGDTLTVSLGSGGTPATIDRGSATVQASGYFGVSWAWPITVDRPITLTGMTFLLGMDSTDAPRAGIWEEATGTLLNPDATVAAVANPTSTFTPYTLQPGPAYRIGWHAPSDTNLPAAYNAPVWTGVTFGTGSYTGSAQDVMPGSSTSAYLGYPSFDLIGYYGGQNTLAQSYVKDLPTDLATIRTRLTALEARPIIDAEFIQDTAATMLGNVGVYNDGAGTYTITLPAARTDEEIQDVVAALIQAGANVAKVYDDVGNVLTLSVSGGGTAPSGNSPGVTVSATAPSDPTTGQQWFDTARGYLLTNTGTSSAPLWRDALGADRTPTGSAFTSYRLNITANNGASFTTVGELTLRSVAGGPQIATGGTASASSEIGANYVATQAFDGDQTLRWAGFAPPQWLRYQLAAVASVVEYVVQVVSPSEGPRDWTFEGSQDGVNWAVLDTRTGEAWGSTYEARTYTITV